MQLDIVSESPRQPEVTALLQASHAYLQSLYDPEDNHFLSVDALCAADILFFVARLNGTAVGTAALALRDGYAEVKSMYVDPASRGRGAAKALMERLIGEAGLRGLPMLKLETGPKNTDAIALYARHGFEVCGAFGAYHAVPASVFMERAVSMPAPRRVLPTEDMSGVLGLLHQAFAYMDGVIDPPSSLHRMSLHDLKRDAEGNELWVIDAGPGSTPVACMILTDKGNTLYLGKMAVADSHRGQGLGRVMIAHAAARAQALGVPSITLQTRVELEANHETFRRFGFEEIGRTAHEGYDRPTSVTFRMGV